MTSSEGTDEYGGPVWDARGAFSDESNAGLRAELANERRRREELEVWLADYIAGQDRWIAACVADGNTKGLELVRERRIVTEQVRSYMEYVR